MESIGDLPWPRTRLSEVLIALESGARPRGGATTSGVVSIGGEHLDGRGGFRLDRPRYVPRSFADRMRSGRISVGDVLVVKDGATTGKVSLVRDSFPLEEAVLNEHVFLCRPNSALDSAFLFYYLVSSEGRSEVLSDFRGAAQGGITRRFAERVHIPLPHIDIQRQVVGSIELGLSRLEEALTFLDSAGRRLNSYRSRIFAAAAAGELALPSMDPALLASRLNWDWSTIADMAEMVIDGDHNPPRRFATGVPHLTARNVKPSGLDLAGCTHISAADFEHSRTRYDPRPGDLLVTCVGTLGRTAIVPSGLVFNADRNLAAIRVRPEHDPRFLKAVIDSPHWQRMIASASGSTAQPHLYLGHLRAISVPTPPLPLQRAIADEIERLVSVIDALATTISHGIRKAERLRAALLRAAFAGQLPITEAA